MLNFYINHCFLESKVLLSKIVVLNDIHPEEQPGAASIAFNFAKELALNHKIEYWYSQGNLKPNLNIENFIIKPFPRFRFVPLQLQNYIMIKRYREFF